MSQYSHFKTRSGEEQEFFKTERTELPKLTWPTIYSFIAIFFCYVLVIFCELYFRNLMYSFEWILSGLLVVFVFFIGISHVFRKWSSFPAKKFLRSLLVWSLLLRVFVMVLLYFVFTHFTGAPYEIGVGYDDHSYHILATEIASEWQQGIFQNPLRFMSLAYSGYPRFCGVLYYVFFPSTIVARIANCIIGSLVVLLIYKISKELWGEKIGQTAGILSMLYPHLIYFSGTQHKDIVLTFLILLVTHGFLKLRSGKKISLGEVALVIAALISMFTFRTVIPVAIMLVWFIIYIMNLKFTSSPGKILRVVIGISVIFISLFGLMKLGWQDGVLDKISSGYSMADIRSDLRGTAGTSLAEYASLPLFGFLAIPAPFVTLVDVPLDRTSAPIRTEGYHIGTILVWNILSFFSLTGIIESIRKKFQLSLPLLLFVFLYLFILAQSNYVMSIRYKLVIMPFLMTFMAVGLQKRSVKTLKWWIVYLFFSAALIIGWNYYRMAGRGLL